jgi:hypothetical protein
MEGTCQVVMHPHAVRGSAVMQYVHSGSLYFNSHVVTLVKLQSCDHISGNRKDVTITLQVKRD